MKQLVSLLLTFLAIQAMGQGPMVSIPFEEFGDHIIIKISVDDSEPLDFIFDTGDGITVLDEDIAEKLELVKHKVILNEGTVTASLIKHNKIEINGFLMEKNIKVYSTDLNHLEISLGRDIDGIIGFDLLHHHTVRIDYDNKIMQIYDLGRFPKFGEPMHFKLNTSIPYVEATVMLNNGESLEGTYFIMTGAGTTMDFNTPYDAEYDLIHKTGEHYSYLVKSISQVETKHYEGRVKSFNLGSSSFDNMPIGISQAKSGTQAHKKISGIIGNKLLKKYNMTIDLPTKTLYLEKNKNFDEPFTVNCSGIDVQLSKDMKKVLIHQIIENSPAASAGLEVDAELVKIDGKSAIDMGLVDIRKKLKASGSTVELVVKNGSGEKTVNLTLKSLL